MKLRKIFAIIILLVFVACVSNAFAQTRLSIAGSTRYKLRGNQVTIYAQKIANNSPVGTHSGTIKLQLWATRRQYTGGTLNGYKLAEIKVGVLNGGNVFREINRTVYYKRPPAGSYYMTLVLAEHDHGRYYTADWKNYPRLQRFR